MVGIEQTNLAVKPLAVATEIQPVRVAEPLARDLGLREGQIVKAMVESENGAPIMLLNERPVRVPPGYPFQPGDAPVFRVVRTPGGLVLQWIERGALPGTEHSADAGGAMRLDGSLPPPATYALPTTILALLNRPPLAVALQALLASNPAMAGLAAAAGIGRPEVLQGSGVFPARLRPAQIRGAIERSGLFADALLAQGSPPAEGDLKTTLRRLRAAGVGDAAMGKVVDDALHDIESSQLQALQAQQRGELYWNLMLPMPDAAPLRMSISRRAPRQEEPRPPYVVQIHSRNDRLGDLWLDVSLFDGPRADLTMWAARPEVALMADASSEALTDELRSAGIALGRFVVNHGPRPDEPAAAMPPAGSIISTEA